MDDDETEWRRRDETKPDDALQRIAMALAREDGCCRHWDADGRCCMTGRARDLLPVILAEIDLCAAEVGVCRAALPLFAARCGIPLTTTAAGAGPAA